MSWGAQNRSKDAKTPSVAGVVPEKSELDLWPVQPYPPAPAVGQRGPTDKGDIARYRLFTTFIFPGCQVGRAPPWTTCRATQPSHGDGRSS
jgi:hypothetical protein